MKTVILALIWFSSSTMQSHAVIWYQGYRFFKVNKRMELRTDNSDWEHFSKCSWPVLASNAHAPHKGSCAFFFIL